MVTVDFKISLPEKLRQEAEKAGLLPPKALERLLRDEIRRRRVDGCSLPPINSPRWTCRL